MSVSIIDKIIKRLKTIPQNCQLQVLKFVRKLEKDEIRGTPGKQLLFFAGSIPLDDVELMHRAIKQDCECVDIEQW